MAKVVRSNPKCFEVLTEHLRELDGLEAKAGWFGSAVYENGQSVAKIAAVQEFGATINHPGGTPYKIGSDGMAVFVAKSSPEASGLPLTKAHTITIPPRPFMRPTVAREKNNWLKYLGLAAQAVLAGKTSAKDALDIIAARAAGDIAKTIASIQSPPLARSTIRRRMNKLSDKKTVGNLTKPLIDSGIMMASISHSVEKSP